MLYDLSLAWRNVTTRKIQTSLTILVVSLAIALFVTIAVLGDGIRQGVITASDPFGVLVIGPKGSAQQLVLSTVLLQGMPEGTIPIEIAEALAADGRVQTVVPLAMGDNVGGARVIGTDESFFSLTSGFGEPPAFRLAQGERFAHDYEAVLGATTAQQLGLTIGDQFVTSHGVERTFEPDEHGQPHTVVGILEPTNSPYDRAVFVNLASVWSVHNDELDELSAPHSDEHEDEHDGHDEDEEHGDEEHEDEEHGHDEHEHELGPTAVDGRITAALVQPINQAVVQPLWQEIQSGAEAQAAFPGRELGGLFDQLRQGERILTAVGYLTAGMAALTVLLALYSATAVQEQSFAIMRSLGASRLNLVRLVIFEALLITLLGALLGRLLGYLLAGIIAETLAVQSAVPIPVRLLPDLEPFLWLMPLMMAFIAGLYPAVMAYRVDVVEKLFPS